MGDHVPTADRAVRVERHGSADTEQHRQDRIVLLS
jgi:hypothetical protein